MQIKTLNQSVLIWYGLNVKVKALKFRAKIAAKSGTVVKY